MLDNGRLLADGTPQTVMREPAVVSAYWGSRPMLEIRGLDANLQ